MSAGVEDADEGNVEVLDDAYDELCKGEEAVTDALVDVVLVLVLVLDAEDEVFVRELTDVVAELDDAEVVVLEVVRVDVDTIREEELDVVVERDVDACVVVVVVFIDEVVVLDIGTTTVALFEVLEGVIANAETDAEL